MGRLLGALLALLLTALAAAQPLPAGGGFDRPWEVGDSSSTSRMALSATESGAVVYWSDTLGVLQRDAAAQDEPLRITEGRGIRQLAAGRVQGDPAVAWANRDLRTGISSHVVSWRGEERTLLEAAQPYEMVVVDRPAGPGLLLSRREQDAHVLRIIEWDGTETVVRESDLPMAKYSAAPLPGGSLAVAWLEGMTERAAIGGAQGEWQAYYAELSPDGRLSPPEQLGEARNVGLESRTAVGAVGEGGAALWPGEDGEVVYSRPGRDPVVLAFGFPVGIAEGDAYWVEGSTIRRIDLSAPGRPPVNVAWSPMTVELGELVNDGEDNYLAWYGPTRGGTYLVYAADDRTPLVPTLLDRVAAFMGWSPWSPWEEATGQTLGSIFAALLIAVSATPLLWLGSLFVGRHPHARRQTLAGMAVAAALLLLVVLVGVFGTQLDLAQSQALFGTPLQLLAALGLGGLLTMVVRSRSDSEPLFGVMVSGGLFLFVAVSVLLFLTYHAWTDYWSFLG